MNELIEKYIHKRKITQEEFKRRFKPWITDHIVNKIKVKNKFLSTMTQSKDRDEKAALRILYNSIKNEITGLIRASKKDYYDRYFTKHKNNLGKTWQGIKQIINMKSKKSDYPSCIIHDGITIVLLQ